MKRQGTGAGKNDNASKMLCLVPSGEILIFMDV